MPHVYSCAACQPASRPARPNSAAHNKLRHLSHSLCLFFGCQLENTTRYVIHDECLLASQPSHVASSSVHLRKIVSRLLKSCPHTHTHTHTLIWARRCAGIFSEGQTIYLRANSACNMSPLTKFVKNMDIYDPNLREKEGIRKV